MSTFSITKEEFKNVHNGVWEIRHAIEQLDGIINDDFMTKLNAGINKLEQGLDGVREQDQTDFDSKFAHYDSVRTDLGLSTTWSVYEVSDLNDRHPYLGAVKLRYKDHWGTPVEKGIVGATWAALFVAANACIRDSGDDHHSFIEQFTPSKEDASVLLLTTGS
jgi:hypothetical protein